MIILISEAPFTETTLKIELVCVRMKSRYTVQVAKCNCASCKFKHWNRHSTGNSGVMSWYSVQRCETQTSSTVWGLKMVQRGLRTSKNSDLRQNSSKRNVNNDMDGPLMQCLLWQCLDVSHSARMSRILQSAHRWRRFFLITTTPDHQKL